MRRDFELGADYKFLFNACFDNNSLIYLKLKEKVMRY